ncbi:MAG: sugar phosphate isomerase/epimerase and 4-hydroxyphenylpyruvate domain-containing protein, partial [Alphaproteobacteria bacterium]|nr:sugar phosphate isomerase/epimerase and 4-hydroxyphenylpyruvate domain-containing protein [Alphaproteobacteria bacterium]
ALAWGRHVNDHRDAWGLVRDVNHPNIGLILDSFHSLSRRVPSSSILDIRAEKLFIIQVADAPLLDMDPLYWSRHFRCMPGQGDFALTEWAEAVSRIGYQGYWSLEIFNDRFREGSATGVATDGVRALRVMVDSIPEQSIAMRLPPKAAVSGIAFIEFAATGDEAIALTAILRGLGFTRTGQHIHKAVTRWQQGGINIVINCEPEGFAHSFDEVHGGSVCAIGLSVQDVPLALHRAEALDIPHFTQAVGPDELQIPAVQGVGGSLIYFLPAGDEAHVWGHEFMPLDAEMPTTPLGLRGVDHVAQTMRYHEFLSWLLYYITLFDVSKTPQVEIADPLGLVLSQAVESPDKALRITLNGALGQDTLSSRFLHNYLGAGVQHIAFTCDDIFAAAAAAERNGLDMLPIPENYYEDVEARFGLDAGLLASLRTGNILYDRDGDAEYFQFYTRAFGKRIFFEVVERRDYQAYGAANATIRLAAQSRYKAGTEQGEG